MVAPRDAQPATVKRPAGRPTSLGFVIEHAEDGTPITAGQRVISIMRAGGYIEHAAAAAGIDKQTVYEWLREGARATHALDIGKEITDHQETCRSFSHAVARAEGEWVAEAGARLAAAARGGRIVTTITTKKDAAGNVIESTERTEVVPPNPAVDQWRLERRMPNLYGRRVVELSGPDGGAIPIEVRARELADNLRAARAAETPPNVGALPVKSTRKRKSNGSNGHKPAGEEA